MVGWRGGGGLVGARRERFGCHEQAAIVIAPPNSQQPSVTLNKLTAFKHPNTPNPQRLLGNGAGWQGLMKVGQGCCILLHQYDEQNTKMSIMTEMQFAPSRFVFSPTCSTVCVCVRNNIEI